MNAKRIVIKEALILVGIFFFILLYYSCTKEIDLPIYHPDIVGGFIEFWKESLLTKLSIGIYFAIPFYSAYLFIRIIMSLTNRLKKSDQVGKIIVRITREILIFLAFFFSAGSLAMRHQAQLMDATSQMAVFWKKAVLVGYPLFQFYRFIVWIIVRQKRQ